MLYYKLVSQHVLSAISDRPSIHFNVVGGSLLRKGAEKDYSHFL